MIIPDTSLDRMDVWTGNVLAYQCVVLHGQRVLLGE